MFIECIAIVALILAMFFIYLRMGKRGIALTILPLATVPFLHTIAILVADNIASFVPAVDFAMVVILFDIIALVVSALMSAFFCMFYELKYRSVYFSIAGVFNVILTFILIFNL